MLLRALVLMGTDAERRRVEDLLDRRDVVVVEGEPGDSVALVDRLGVDLVLADEAAVSPDTLESWARKVRGMADAPGLVAFVNVEDATRRAGLLAEGYLAVLNLRVRDAELRRTMRALAHRRRDEAAARAAAERLRPAPWQSGLVAESEVMKEAVGLAQRIAGADSSVLLLGETGVGKERFAQGIHAGSRRAAGPFVPVNCGAIPEGLLESELFGHEQGAFTGAIRSRRGRFELAHGGTLFLDEIGEIPQSLQVKLLRVLEDRRVERLGAEVPLPVDVRVVAATNRALEEEVAAGRFRADLYYRLAVITVVIPPLRERPEDIRPLVAQYLGHFSRSLAKPVDGIAPDALRALDLYPWPGNVRELMNVLERAILLSSGPQITVADLPRGVVAALSRPSVPLPPPLPSGGSRIAPLRSARQEAMRAFERQYLTNLLAAAGGRIGESARRAGVNERTLYDLMRKHDLRKEDFRSAVF
jgi:transcriptional regulator with PAS, ATPase and Fis domain